MRFSCTPKFSNGRAALVPLVLLGQALLLFFRLELLPAWGDELFTLHAVVLPIREILTKVQGDIHPPLYYILLHEWIAIPLPWSMLAALRAFSGVMALLATLALDAFWLRRWNLAQRSLGLCLFAFSPCLLLYGRMARSYAMQTLLVLLTVSLLWRWMCEPRRWLRYAVPACAALTALLYTHYLPGLAVLVAFAVVGSRRVGLKPVLLFCTAALVGYAPWGMTLFSALNKWRAASGFYSHYALSGALIAEQILKVLVASVSLTIGECFSPISLFLVPGAIAGMVLGVRTALQDDRRALILLVAISAVLGFLGASRWVTWPFLAARLLWLLPFLALALTRGLFELRRRPRAIAGAALLVSSACSILMYFHMEGFVNLGYTAPVREIASRLRAEGAPSDFVLIDGYNADSAALRFYLGAGIPSAAVLPGSVPPTQEQSATARIVWVVRNMRDVSPGHILSAAEATACTGRARSEVFYHLYAGWQRSALRLLGDPDPPTHLYKLTACR